MSAAEDEDQTGRITSPIIVVLRPHEDPPQLLGHEHQHHAGYEAEQPVEAEGRSMRKGGVLGDEDVDRQEQSAHDVQAHSSRDVAGWSSQWILLSPCLRPAIAARSSLRAQDAFEEDLSGEPEKKNQAEKCRQAKGDDDGHGAS